MEVKHDIMEQLIQKYIKYFYITLIGITMIQLIDVIIKTIQGDTACNTFALIFLSIINIVLLISSLIHNIKQRFTECKTNAKILRFTIAMLMGLQAFLCYKTNPSLVSLGNHLVTIVVIEIILDYRIKSIEYLEKRAGKLAKNTTPN